MDSTEPLHYLSIDKAGSLIRAGKLSPVDLTESYLERIDRLNPTLQSYIRVEKDSARADAKAMDKEIARGHFRGPLHGIPIALKDLVDTKGVATTFCAATNSKRQTVTCKHQSPLYEQHITSNTQHRRNKKQ